ncbi:His-Xaa-Ser system radical SAM maturase HxsC [Novosphingobium sp. Gsoil 351]|uniref:His-Xaa-Ser system radical SAM maturase HxsC n=1 Tax=Novosphingobium sp. Gsoil 351 TaxID=2675225 RepID=UPI0012B4E86C|nr:His-Xaa-Ser system radical SAM maturase HxsC [Novosphingobium sp. Gsoil 351]QGN54230.1 His-Xaa-Ser system radical SAM maturase HxsC [Novosphingobium sp. Gsoil 351]
MIPLRLPAAIEAERPFVTRIEDAGARPAGKRRFQSWIVGDDVFGLALAGDQGLFTIDGIQASQVVGDVLLVDPIRQQAERLIRADSLHNTLLVTERCDQLCQMCSQPPKKTHEDRFELLRQASLLAPEGATLGITGGEPTLYKNELFDLIEITLGERPDMSFHVLSNGQHFEQHDVGRLRNPAFARVTWGIPLYSSAASEHDAIVGKPGAFERLHQSFGRLVEAGARVELRTVVLSSNAFELPALAKHIVWRLPFIGSWSVMQLENIGFAKNRWSKLFFDHRANFTPIAEALDRASLHALQARLFNFPLCTVPPAYRSYAVRSISDWKQKYVAACDDCSLKPRCAGFFEWHSGEHANAWVRPE